MSSEWRTFSVDELVRARVLAPPSDGNHGEIHPKSSDFVASGVPFIMASDLKAGRVDIEGCAFITAEQAATLRKGFAKAGDVLLSHKATLGRTAIVEPSAFDFLVLTPQVTYYRVLDRSSLNNRYLKYYFDSEPFQQTLASWAGSGSTRAYLGITAQRKLPIVVPPIAIQNAVAGIISALDDRIALLRETNATLEAIAQALFKSWFVDFDPVRAKSQGLAPAGMDEATVALFPDGFEESALGPIPTGWRAGTVSDYAHMHRGSVSPSANPGSHFEHYSLPAFDSGQMPICEDGAAIKSNKTSVPPEAVLLSKLNPHIPRIWLPFNPGPLAVCSTEFLVFVPASGAAREFVYASFLAPAFVERLRQLVTGTSNSHQRVKPDSVLELSAAIPPVCLQAAFASAVGPILRRVGQNRLQAQSLAALRDTLLPRLISGQLRLPVAEAEALAA